jgi:DNA-directed RNA polymerase subunit N (RpoN/RPB10)
MVLYLSSSIALRKKILNASVCRKKGRVIAKDYAHFMLTARLDEAPTEALDDVAAKVGLTRDTLRELELKRGDAANTIGARHVGLAFKVCPSTT